MPDNLNFIASHLEQRIESLSIENKNLRSMLLLNQNFNSLKSYEEEYKKLESEKKPIETDLQTKKDAEDENSGGDSHGLKKKSASDIIRKTIKDRNKRMGRKRTDSFHMSSLSDESPDNNVDTPAKPVINLQPTYLANEFSGYKMKVDDTPSKDSEQSKAFSFSSSSEEVKSETSPSIKPKRKRIRSDDVSSDIKVLSPPLPARDKPRRISTVVEEPEEMPSSLKKGGGYKMSISSIEESKKESTSEEETKALPEDPVDDDYFG